MFYANMLNYAQMFVPFKYLRLQVGGNPRKKEFWKEVVDKVRRKLSKWKGKKLFFAGKVCMIKLVFSNIVVLLILIQGSNIDVQRDYKLAKEVLLGVGK